MSARLAGLSHPKAPADGDQRLRELQLRLAELQVAYHRQNRSALILVEGWDAAGKGGLLKRMTAELDPRFFEVVPIAAPFGHERDQHYLQRFFRWLPEAGDWTIFDRTWYGRVLVERVEGLATDAAWQRAYGEIEAVERMLADSGVSIVKLFLHIEQDEQDRRFIDRLETPWKRWKMGPEDFRNRARRADYLVAYEEMFARTDFPFARWHLIGANHKKWARIDGLSHLVERLSDGVDLTPPALDPELRVLAERALGIRLLPR
ncbi:polyphosphate kinase 2 family protein [Thermaurantiacus sp.]